jgi:hypothetical protein
MHGPAFIAAVIFLPRETLEQKLMGGQILEQDSADRNDPAGWVRRARTQGGALYA